MYRFDQDDFLLVVNAANKDKDLAHFNQHLKDFPGVEIHDVTDELAMIAFQGPCSHDILSGLKQGGRMPDPRQNCLGKITLCGVEVLISRTGYTGEPNSFELFVPAAKAEEVWQAILDAGKDQGVMPIGLGARDTLRLEAGMPLYGHELGEDPEGKEFPIFGIGLAPVAVSFSPLKGDFVGGEALLDQLEAHGYIRDGVLEPPQALPRRVMCLALEDKGVPRAGYEVYQGDKKVGYITSGTSVPYWKLQGQGTMMTLTDEHAVRPLALAIWTAISGMRPSWRWRCVNAASRPGWWSSTAAPRPRPISMPCRWAGSAPPSAGLWARDLTRSPRSPAAPLITTAGGKRNAST